MLFLKNAEIKKWYHECANMLKGSAPTIDEFVKRSNALKNIYKKFPNYKNRFMVI